jgi:hypothetical protein
MPFIMGNSTWPFSIAMLNYQRVYWFTGGYGMRIVKETPHEESAV